MRARTRPKRIVAVDWDPRTLRIVHAHIGKRGLKIDRLLSVGIPSGVDTDDPGQMGMHIRRTLDQEGITTRHALVDVPRDQAILKTLQLPTTQPDELPGMVEIQIAKELPFPAGEAVIDFTVESDGREGPTGDVLVAAIRRELLEQYQATFEAAELKLDRIGLRPHANKIATCEFLRHAVPERVLFIDVRPTFMEIDVLRNGALAFSRSASVTIPANLEEPSILSLHDAPPSTPGDEDHELAELSRVAPPARRAKVVESLLMEVTRSIEAYRANDPGASIDQVVIGGDVGVEEMLAELIQTKLMIGTEIYNPASTFGWEPDEGVGAVAFAAALGLVLGHAQEEAAHFDFLHPKKTESATQKRLKKVPMVAAIVLLFLASGAVGLNQYTKADRERLATLEREIAVMQSRRSEGKKFLKVMDQISAFEESQHVWVDVLYDILTQIPSNAEMLVNHIEVKQKDGQVTLKTAAKRRETATDVILTLEAFRRDGWEKPRFKVRMGPQTEKKRERYPFFQDFRITVLGDDPKSKPKQGR